MARAQDIFRRHDRDASGDIDAVELHAALRELGMDPSRAHVRGLMQQYDTDQNTRIDQREFLALVQDVQQQQVTAHAQDVFTRHDRDGSGAIDVRELASALRELGLDPSTSEAHRILRQYDDDRSERLELGEFLKLVRDVLTFQAEARRGGGGGGGAAVDAAPAHAAPAAAPPAPAADHSSADDVERTFRRFDADRSGDIDVHELREALAALGLSTDSEQAAKIMARYDADRSGGLQLPEFRTLVEELREFKRKAAAAHLPPATPATPEDNVEAAFRRADADGSGGIDEGELLVALNDLGLETDAAQARVVMQRYDADRSGTLELDEFRRLVQELKDFQARQRAQQPGSSGASQPADDIEATFRRFDVDGSGDIDVAELAQAMSALGVQTNSEQASAVMARYDADRSGGLQLPEFRALVEELRAFQARAGA